MRHDLTAAQVENMRHALGLNQYALTKPYRNFFWTDADGEDGRTWAPLVERGLAWASKPQKDFGGTVMFAVTDAGLAALGITDLSGLEPKERFVGKCFQKASLVTGAKGE
ncbi:MAG: hypothetical protein ACREH4_08175 [Vitreimonas sp.]